MAVLAGIHGAGRSIRARCRGVVVTIITGVSGSAEGPGHDLGKPRDFGLPLIALGLFGLDGIIPFTGWTCWSTPASRRSPSAPSLHSTRSPCSMHGIWSAYGRSGRTRFLYRVNNLITGVWGGIFAINLVVSYLAFAYPHATAGIALPLTYLILIAGIIFTIWYPGHIPEEACPVRSPTGSGVILAPILPGSSRPQAAIAAQVRKSPTGGSPFS